MKNLELYHIDRLRDRIWQKFFDAPQPRAEKWMGKKVSETIDQDMGEALEQRGLRGAPHPDTIVNLLNQSHVPKRSTLDKLSWYLLGDASTFKTFYDFKQLCDAHGESFAAEKLDNI